MRKEITETQGITLGRQIPYGLCLHMDNGTVPIAKNCIHHYECWHCAFDQWLEEMKERQNAQKIAKLPGRYPG